MNIYPQSLNDLAVTFRLLDISTNFPKKEKAVQHTVVTHGT